MDDEELKLINKWLQRSDRKKIAADFSIGIRQASNILSGKSKNMPFVMACLEAATKNKAAYDFGIARLKEMTG